MSDKFNAARARLAFSAGSSLTALTDQARWNDAVSQAFWSDTPRKAFGAVYDDIRKAVFLSRDQEQQNNLSAFGELVHALMETYNE